MKRNHIVFVLTSIIAMVIQGEGKTYFQQAAILNEHYLNRKAAVLMRPGFSSILRGQTCHVLNHLLIMINRLS